MFGDSGGDGYGGGAPAGVEVEYNSYGSRLGGSLGSACCGVLLFFFSFYLLGTNEKRAVQTAETIDEGRHAVVQTDSCTPQNENDGKLTSMVSCAVAPGHFPGQKHAGRVHDPALLVGLPTGAATITTKGYLGDNVLSWTRSAEQYQYIESSTTREEKLSGGATRKITIYSYTKGWSSIHQTWRCTNGCVTKCRQDLGYNEPCQPTAWSEAYAASSDGQVDRIFLSNSGSTDAESQLWIGTNSWGKGVIPSVGPSHDLFVTLNGGHHHLSVCDGQHLQYSVGSQSSDPYGGGGYSGGGYSGGGYSGGGYGSGGCDTQIGDWRWSWRYHTVPHSGLSVLAEQTNAGNGATFDSWKTGKDVTWLAINEIGMVQDGACDGDCMLDEMESMNTVTTWLFRFLGWVVMGCSLSMILHPIAVAPAVIPCIGHQIEDLVGCFLCVFSCCVASALSLFTIALAWLWVRPMVGIPLLLLCCCATGGAAFVMKEGKKRKAAGKTAAMAQGYPVQEGGKQAAPVPPPGAYGTASPSNPYAKV
eukprot:Hpha_TRINITY_DN15482_c2_g1::TRINITY_DN15482_c2_g1_i1::g.172687::m.172687